MENKMKLYQCHKRVRAARIIDVHLIKPQDPNQVSEFYPASLVLDNGTSLQVDIEWMRRHRPRAGGFLVKYEDGYTSFSPGRAFQDGYREINAYEVEEYIASLKWGPETNDEVRTLVIGNIRGALTKFGILGDVETG